ncbi:MAG: DNA repair protein RadC [Alphaproteobacteria bacterium]|nr:DNA repair protein RadC [Alphaproteobacteria bacterium]
MTETARIEKTRPKAHYEGHRDRLRARLLESGANALQDYELLEVLLFAAIPRRDVKPMAKSLLSEFNGLWEVLNATPARLCSFGLSLNAISLLRVVSAIELRATRSFLMDKPLLNNWQRVVDYCRDAMSFETKEQFRLLFLDRRNRLISEEVQQRGTVDHTPVYPREIVQRALEVGAGAIILAHNHPSGDVTPSKADIDMTRLIQSACLPLGLTIHDHIIVGHDNVASFKALGLL